MAARATAARVIAETPGPERLGDLYRRCTGSLPSRAIAATMERTLETFLERYRDDTEAARALVSMGESEPPADVAVDELAAWTMLASAVMSSDAAIVKD